MPPHGLPARPAASAPAPQPWAHTAHAVTAALANPYSHNQSPHYAQAYANHYAAQQATPQGYTYSSTYTPGPSTPSTSYAAQQPSRGRGGPPAHRGGHQQPSGQHWYSAGSARCSHPGCAFAGSAKAVETHMMDRHLIYPPGWDKRKRRGDWDADPSLKGKPILIQGTNVSLETPADIEKWIEERKRRWPTTERVEEKKRKLEEAVARGQIYPDDARFKRRRVDEDAAGKTDWQDGGRGRGRGRGRGAERGRGRGRGRGASAMGSAQPRVVHPLPAIPLFAASPADEKDASSSGSDDDGAPEVASSKPSAALVDFPVSSGDEGDKERSAEAPIPEVLTTSDPAPSLSVAHPAISVTHQPKQTRRPPPQPKRVSHNPFGPKSSLLRNLLLPEIRMTVSNLSQAIHFLVDNDFLENVEMKAGQASEKMIEVVGEQQAASTGGAESQTSEMETTGDLHDSTFPSI
ncbi:hypothetical protein FA95DRAFT_191388 [Auriscalpium vulgare]|uniref:Uncharacterized protein n=1 Tax=Auriscalpium vulgare TaxID=40419 RepID=A0ACB8S682_9AGAM|nr:hypothetical protein FA95DRAFT_191388 [Auriscalpium vulgare]